MLLFIFAGLGFTMKQNLTLLFKKIHLKDVWLIIWLTIVTIIVSNTLAVIAAKFTSLASNPSVIPDSSAHPAAEYFLNFSTDIFQLLGEEFYAIIPFLLLLQWFTHTFGWSRKKAILVAWLLSSLLFGAMHLSTYNWNLLQSLMVIGVTRLFLTYAYLKTKNIWVSYIVHLLYDSILFALPLLGL
ncbi:CPBP family intramembrane glutamic endopeptidase [Listeria floridensis]|nr:CPBP family intramembrane glutamic endopeptidase [Listeria floridensis]